MTYLAMYIWVYSGEKVGERERVDVCMRVSSYKKKECERDLTRNDDGFIRIYFTKVYLTIASYN